MKFYFPLILIVFSACSYNSQVNQMNSKYNISIIYFDSLSEDEMGKFPISKNYYAQLIEKLEKSNPKYIILKFLFTDKTDDDSILIETLKKYNNILTQAAVISGKSEVDLGVLADCKISANDYDFPNYDNAWLPYNEIGKHFSGIGFANIITDDENKLKEFYLINSLYGDIYPSLPLLILQKELDKEILITKNDVSIGNTKIPINSNGCYPLDLSIPQNLYKSYSFIDVIHDKINTDLFEDNIVIVFVNLDNAPKYFTGSKQARNVAEIVADAINSALKYLE